MISPLPFNSPPPLAVKLLTKSKLIEGPLDVAQKYSIRANVSKILSLRKYIPSIGYSILIITTSDGISHPPFFFHEGGLKEFLTVFFGVAHISRQAPLILLLALAQRFPDLLFTALFKIGRRKTPM